MVPDLAPALAGQWINNMLPIYVETAPNKWSKRNLYGSLLQGGQDGHPVFCLALAMALTRAIQRFEGHAICHEQQGAPARARMWRQVTYWAYVDDITIQAPVEVLACTLQLPKEEMATLNLLLEPSKCKCLVPALTGVTPEMWPPQLRQMCAHWNTTITPAEQAVLEQEAVE